MTGQFVSDVTLFLSRNLL